MSAISVLKKSIGNGFKIAVLKAIAIEANLLPSNRWLQGM